MYYHSTSLVTCRPKGNVVLSYYHPKWHHVSSANIFPIILQLYSSFSMLSGNKFNMIGWQIHLPSYCISMCHIKHISAAKWSDPVCVSVILLPGLFVGLLFSLFLTHLKNPFLPPVAVVLVNTEVILRRLLFLLKQPMRKIKMLVPRVCVKHNLPVPSWHKLWNS